MLVDTAEKQRRLRAARPESEDPSAKLAWRGQCQRWLLVRPGDLLFICNSPSVHVGADLAQEEVLGNGSR